MGLEYRQNCFFWSKLTFWSKLASMSMSWHICQIKHFRQNLYLLSKLIIPSKSYFWHINCFDNIINYWQLYLLWIFSSTIWLKYQLCVPVNCNIAKGPFFSGGKEQIKHINTDASLIKQGKYHGNDNSVQRSSS